MNGFKLFIIITAGFFLSSAAFADIYEWTDADGIKHYSNYAPPKNSRILMKTKWTNRRDRSSVAYGDVLLCYFIKTLISSR